LGLRRILSSSVVGRFSEIRKERRTSNVGHRTLK
jgi:hypothetical protein